MGAFLFLMGTFFGLIVLVMVLLVMNDLKGNEIDRLKKR